jgi:hypothetical protein
MLQVGATGRKPTNQPKSNYVIKTPVSEGLNKIIRINN